MTLTTCIASFKTVAKFQMEKLRQSHAIAKRMDAWIIPELFILGNSGGTEHAQTVCTRLFFSPPMHKSLRTRLTSIQYVVQYEIVG